MPYWQDHEYSYMTGQPEKKKNTAIISLAVLLVALGVFFSYTVWNHRETSVPSVPRGGAELSDWRLSELIAALTYNNPHDIPYLDEILSRSEALDYARSAVGSSREEERYLALLIFQQTPSRSGQIVDPAVLDTIQSTALLDTSSAIQLYAATTLLLFRDYAGVPKIINHLASPLPLTFMEPVMTEGTYAHHLLSAVFQQDFGPDPAAAQPQWDAWWSNHKEQYIP